MKDNLPLGYPEIVAVRVGSLKNIDLYAPENCCG
jgi:hypothetical protein